MSNGFIRHKKVQWVFDDKFQMMDFNPRAEGVYALDNHFGDIYVWNGSNWMLYERDAIKLSKYHKTQPDNWRRLNDIPPFPVSASFYADVDIYPGNFGVFTNAYDDRPYVKQTAFSASVDLYPDGYVVTSSFQSVSGSFYTSVSMSIA